MNREQFWKGIRHPRKAARFIHRRTLRPTRDAIEARLTRSFGTYLFDHDWDCAIILDACRIDLARENVMARDLLGDPTPVWSCGGNSETWLRRTFGRASHTALQNTHYVTANLFSNEAVPPTVSRDDVWEYGFDDTLGTIPPRVVTDRAIHAGRTRGDDRLVVHYMQPHLPPVTDSLDEDMWIDTAEGWGERNPWRRIANGDLAPEKIVNAYRANLTPVLEEVALLLSNLDAERVVVTADHGNALGEWGQWGHYDGRRLNPAVRRVPWWTTTADDGTHQPAEYTINESADRAELLRSLGYTSD